MKRSAWSGRSERCWRAGIDRDRHSGICAGRPDLSVFGEIVKATDASHRYRGPEASALLRSLRDKSRRKVLNGFAPALRATRMSGVMLGEMFGMLENLAALLATVLIRRHGASPL